MRPRHKAAEYGEFRTAVQAVQYLASMRPRHKAAEYEAHVNAIKAILVSGFNEAAA